MSSTLAFSTAFADLPHNEYVKEKAEGGIKWQAERWYFAGMETAFRSANVDLGFRHLPRLYCQPPSFAMNIDNILELVEEQVANAVSDGRYNEKYPNDDWDVSVLLIGALKKAFPCK